MSAQNSPSNIIEWIRDKADSLDRMADEMESIFRGLDSTALTIREGPLTVEELILAIKEKNGRASNFSRRLNVTKAEVNSVIQNSNGIISIGDRGWMVVNELQAGKESL